MEKNEVVTFSEAQVFELVQIVFDGDKDAALKFLEDHVYKPLQKRKEARCKPELG
jgi:hypothetical protein